MRKTGGLRCCRERGLESSGDIIVQIETALLAAGSAPIDNQRPQTIAGEMPQKTPLGQEVDDIITVDQ